MENICLKTKKGRHIFKVPEDPLAKKWFKHALKQAFYKSALIGMSEHKMPGVIVKMPSVVLTSLSDYTRRGNVD